MARVITKWGERTNCSTGGDPSPDGGGLHVARMDLSELRSVHGGGDAPLSRQAVEGGVVILAGDPHGLAIGEAGGSGEDHGSGCELREL